MLIFLPFKRDQNTFLDEIEEFSNAQFIYGGLNEYTSEYDIVNIHWPEALFDWYEPSKEDLEKLEKQVTEWKRHSVLVYTKHDFQRNKGTTPAFDRLFQIIESNADVFVHLGDFSRKLYKRKYPDVRHELLYHPLYKNSFKVQDRDEARLKLKINKDALVIIAPGKIRNFKERDMILRAFDKIQEKNKVLISTNMHAEIRYDFRGRIRLKRFFDVKKWQIERFKSRYSSPNYIFAYNKLSSDQLALKVAAADLVLVPRTDILNSGNVFLGFTFNKVVVGPDIGNISEQLKELGLPVFNPNSVTSVINAIKKGIELTKLPFSYPKDKLVKYQPETIAENMDKLMKDII